MLILSRKVGETIQIGSDVIVSINRIGGGRVTVGIDAPRDIAIRRGELPVDGGVPDAASPIHALDFGEDKAETGLESHGICL